jgi:hypothetical protein
MLVDKNICDHYQKATFTLMMKKKASEFISLSWDNVARTPSVAGAGSYLYSTINQHSWKSNS